MSAKRACGCEHDLRVFGHTGCPEAGGREKHYHWWGVGPRGDAMCTECGALLSKTKEPWISVSVLHDDVLRLL